jgi:hypothetical protein
MASTPLLQIVLAVSDLLISIGIAALLQSFLTPMRSQNPTHSPA